MIIIANATHVEAREIRIAQEGSERLEITAWIRSNAVPK